LLLISRKEKEKIVIKLPEEGKTTGEIAEAVHISLKDIGKIIRKETGDDVNENPKKDNEKDKEKWLKSLSPYVQAFQMFRERKIFAYVVIELDIDTDTVLNYSEDYLILVRTNSFMAIYYELKDDLPTFIHLYRRIKEEKLTKQDITNLLQNSKDLKIWRKELTYILNISEGNNCKSNSMIN
jgi:hypothetical protein